MPNISWTPFVFLRYLCFLIIGITLEIHFPLQLKWWIILNLSVFIFYIVFFKFLSRAQHYKLRTIFGFLAFFFLISAGGILSHCKNERNSSGHLLHLNERIECFSGTINSEVQRKGNWFRSELLVKMVKTQGGWHHRSGRILIYQPLKDSLKKMSYGDVYLIKALPAVVKPPDNPFDFDFKKYLSYKQVFHQCFLKDNYSLVDKGKGNKLINLSLFLREKGDKVLKQFIPGRDEAILVSALILGVKNELDHNLKAAYSKIGVIHVLAVSGMHIALIFQLLLLGLGKVKQIKKGNLIFGLISLSIIWLFAFITGLSSSVLRAAVMFTFILLSQIFLRQKNTYNNIALSAFCLLIYDPFLIVDIGFQLSYLAVLGIVYLYPKIYILIDIKSRAGNYLWATTAITLAAQIATSPLSVFYFDQFPTYFLFSNLIIISLTSIVLYLGIALLMFFWIPVIGKVLGYIIYGLIWVCNEVVYFTDALPLAAITGIDVNLLETVLIYIAIATLLILFYAKRLKYMVGLFIIVSIFSVSVIQRMFSENVNNQLLIYKSKKKELIELRSRNESVLVNADTLTPMPTNEMKGIRILVWKGKTIMISEKPFLIKGFRNSTEKIPIDILLIRNSSMENLQELIKAFNIKYLIISPDNSKSVTEKIIKDASLYAQKVHSISRQGAFLMTFSN